MLDHDAMKFLGWVGLGWIFFFIYFSHSVVPLIIYIYFIAEGRDIFVCWSRQMGCFSGRERGGNGCPRSPCFFF